MGLEITHNCYGGPFSHFHRWRTEIGRVAGYPTVIRRVDFVGVRKLEEDLVIDQTMLPPNCVQGDWDHLPEDPLMVLLVHSDCDGHIKAEHCARWPTLSSHCCRNWPEARRKGEQTPEQRRHLLMGCEPPVPLAKTWSSSNANHHFYARSAGYEDPSPAWPTRCHTLRPDRRSWR